MTLKEVLQFYNLFCLIISLSLSIILKYDETFSGKSSVKQSIGKKLSRNLQKLWKLYAPTLVWNVQFDGQNGGRQRKQCGQCGVNWLACLFVNHTFVFRSIKRAIAIRFSQRTLNWLKVIRINILLFLTTNCIKSQVCIYLNLTYPITGVLRGRLPTKIDYQYFQSTTF